MPISLDEKKKGGRHLFSRNKGAKIGRTFSEYTFLIIPLYWASLYLSRKSIGVCKENYIRKGERDNSGSGTGTVDGDGVAGNLGTGTNIGDTDVKNRGANNPSTGIDIANIKERANDLGTAIDTKDINRRANNPGIGTSTSIINTDRKADNSSTGTDTTDANVDRKTDLDKGIDKVDIDTDEKVDNPNIRTVDAEKQVATSSKAHMFLFSLHKALFFRLFFWIGDRFCFSLSLFIFSSILVTLVK